MKKAGRNKLKKIVVLVLLVATIIHIVKLKLAVDAYKEWLVEYELQHPGALMPNFWETSFANNLALITIILTGAWFLLNCLYMKRLSVSILIALFLCLCFATPSLAVDTVYYDILLVKDEEVGDWSINIMEDLEDVAAYYEETFNIVLRFHGWIEWDSCDSETRMAELLYEAVGETEWYWKKVVDGEEMELLLVFTMQQDTDLIGFSATWLRACIIKKSHYGLVHLPVHQRVLHEMGHQFCLEHCTNHCAMNSEPFLFVYGKYCSDCEAELMEHRYELHNPPPPPPPPPPPNPPIYPSHGGCGGLYGKLGGAFAR